MVAKLHEVPLPERVGVWRPTPEMGYVHYMLTHAAVDDNGSLAVRDPAGAEMKLRAAAALRQVEILANNGAPVITVQPLQNTLMKRGLFVHAKYQGLWKSLEDSTCDQGLLWAIKQAQIDSVDENEDHRI